MSKVFQFAAFALLGAFAASPVYADDKSAALVNGVSIPQSRVDLRVHEMSNQSGQPDSPELRAAVRDELINIELLSQEASKSDLSKQTEIQQQLELARQSILARAYVQDYVKNHPIGDDVLKQEYDKLTTTLGPKEYKVQHILVKDEAEAKAIAAQLKKGAKFDKLAKEKSIDAGSSKNGGALGWSFPSNFVKPFADALVGLGKGKVSEPVQSQFGWHIIKLEDVRASQLPSFDQFKPNLTQRMQQQAVQKMVSELRGKAKVE
ncbi:MAG TPA: peptidylprolyl isomerase [Gallionellaceae bacterium]|nr:peptidylprolyl isomerase [Gallionellaceae bacterium]